jgi:rod shape-determining protein MreD
MEGQITGFFAGLVEDIFSVQLFGIHSFIKLIIGHIAGHIYTNFVVEHFGIQFVLGFVAALLQGILFILSKAVFAQIDVGYYLKTVLWIQVLYTAVLTPVFFAILNFMEKRFGEP